MPDEVYYSPHDRPLFWIGMVTGASFTVYAVLSLTRESWLGAGVGAVVGVIGFLNARRHWKAMH
ncbi:hypothetical protein GEV27_08135 [Aeromicrobium sp. S22]|uniref:hypothetical protein n=1 Tax=Aeromicrobium sp. S22 TaxID=2662029 RepID=UPI00129E505E|nr:hypothetical protein [Aeromicrobium sp. S22]MRK01487.1 hypothetical protein [Aeromicrobium sp. S22]